MANNNTTSTILSEHRRVVSARFTLAIFNFIAILLGTLVTLFFVTKRGCFDLVLKHIYALIVINVIQLSLCIADGFLRRFRGIYCKPLPIISYVVGAVWLVTLVSEMVVATMENGVLRIDLLAVAVIQVVVALMAYIIWPMLDKGAIDAMILPGVRDNAEKKQKKSKRFVAVYGSLCAAIVLAQAIALLAYKIPPRLYDLFAESRALQYELSDDGESYIVKNVYRGTSSYVNIPATYNNKPVVGIAAGALIDDTLSEKYRITEITFGDKTIDENGDTVWVSNLQYIESNAIKNNRIESLAIPSSVKVIGNGAIKSESLQQVQYSASADFAISYLECTALSKIVISGNEVGQITSLEGMSPDVLIEVSKDIYNKYREDNIAYVDSFRPILADNEFCIDFYTNCDYYIDSIFCQIGDSVYLTYNDLQNENVGGVSPAVDTLAYIKNNHELGTNGIKANSAFRGWYYDSDYSLECVFTENGNVKFSKNVSLYAKWIPEYQADLNWGSFKPVNAETRLHWTDEDVVELPVILGRLGYQGGVQWFQNGSSHALTNTQTLSESTTLYASWVLDAPEIDINPNFVGTGLGTSGDKNYVHFTYDEANRLTLEATKSHPLDGLNYNGAATYYTYAWKKAGSGSFNHLISTLQLKNVADAGDYTLCITAHSPYGESATSETQISVSIARKQLDMGTAGLAASQSTYDGKAQSVTHTGTVGSPNVEVSYKFYNSLGNACTPLDAGTYRVEATFAKNNATEAANYEATVLTSTFTIAPKPLQFGGWTGADSTWNDSSKSFVYDGTQRRVLMNVSGILANDTVTLEYANNFGTNANTYYAVVRGVSNPNYTLDEIDGDLLRYEWKIDRKQITVKRWLLNGSFNSAASVIYSGAAYTVTAELAGAIAGDTVRFNYAPLTSAYKQSATHAGAYTARIEGVSNDNYYFDTTSSEASYNWTIAKRAITVSFAQVSTLTYNGLAQKLVATLSGFATGEVSDFDVSMFDYSDKSAALQVKLSDTDVANNSLSLAFEATNAGSYKAALSGLVSNGSALLNNYTLAAASADFSIQPKKITISKIGTYTYNGQVQDLKLLVSGFVSADLASLSFEQFTTTAVAGKVATNGYELIWKGTNADAYAVSVGDFEYINDNYVLDAAYSNNIVIQKKVLSVSEWKLRDEGSTAVKQLLAGMQETYNHYGYKVYPVLSGVADGETVELQLTSDSFQDVGHYTTVATMDGDVYSNYVFDDASISWEITPYELDFDWKVVGEDGFNFIYDGYAKTIAPIYTLLGTDSVTLTYHNAANLSQKDAGTYTVAITSLGNSNYVIGSGATTSYTISPKKLTVQWVASSYADLVYTGQYQGPAFSLVGVSDADIAAGNITLSVQASANTYVNGSSMTTKTFALTAANAYAFLGDQAFAVDAGEYTVENFRILKNGSLDGNYEISDEVTFAIAKKVITLSGDWSYTNKGSTLAYTAASKLTYNKNSFALTTSIAGGLVARLSNVSPDAVTLSYQGASYSNAGEYTAMVVGLSGTYSKNYALPENNLSCSWKIAPKVITLTWTSNSFVYSGNEMIQRASITSGAASDTDGKIYSGDSYSLVYQNNTGINAKSYTASVTALGNSNYALGEDSNATYTWSIAPRPVTLTWTYGSTIYNAAVQYPTASYYFGGQTIEVTEYSGKDNIHAGTYTVTATLLDDANFTLEGGSNLSKEYKISPRTITYSWYVVNTNASPLSGLVYDGTIRTVKANITNLASPDDVVTLTYSNNTFKNAGTYTATITDIDNDDYQLASTNEVTYTVAKKAVTFTWHWDGDTDRTAFTYDGSIHTLTATVNGAVTGEVLTVSSYVNALSSAVNANSYTVTVASISDENNYTFASANKSETLIIDKQKVTITWSGAQSITYDGAARTLIAVVKGADDGLSVDFNYDSYGNAFVAAGNHTARVYSLNDSNYTLTGAEGSLTRSIAIAKKVVTLAWSVDNTTYDGSTHSAFATVTNKGADSVSVYYAAKRVSSHGSISSSANGTSSAGVYTITVTGVSNANYTVDGASNTSQTLTIAQQKVTITWEGATALTYDRSAHYLTASIVGAVDGKTVSFGYATRPSATNVGSYTYKIGSLSVNNYTLEGANGTTEKTLVISPRVITLSWPETRAFEYYFGKTHSITPAVSNICTGDNIQFTYAGEVLSSIGSIGKTSNGASDAGTYRVTVTGQNNSNYTLVGSSNLSADFVIAPQAVTVSWSGTTEVTYNGNVHKLVASVVGLKDGRAVDFTYAADPDAVNAGTHVFRVGALTNTNYTLSGVSASDLKAELVINPRMAILSWTQPSGAVYNGAAHKAVARVTNLCSGDDVTIRYSGTLLSEIGAIASTSNGATDAGTYQVTVVGLDSENYTLEGTANTTATFTIAPCAVTVRWPASTTVVYNGKAQTLTPVVSGVNGAAVSYLFDESGNSYTNVGVYTVSVSALQDSNYTLEGATNLSATFTIAPCPVTVSWSGESSVTYNGNEHTLVASVTGVNGEDISFTYDDNGNAFTNVGTYTVKVASIDSDNYTLDGAVNTEKNLVVSPAALALTWELPENAAENGEPIVWSVAANPSFELTYTITDGDDLPCDEISHAGTYTITVTAFSGEGSTNYTLTGADTVRTLTVAKESVSE